MWLYLRRTRNPDTCDCGTERLQTATHPLCNIDIPIGRREKYTGSAVRPPWSVAAE